MTLDSTLTIAARAQRTATGRHLSALGLYPGQDAILRLLAQEDNQTQTQLATALQVEPPTVTKTLQRLETAGIVTRKADKNDGRVSRVKLTAKGRRLQVKVEAAIAQVNKEATRGLTVKDITAITKALDLITANLVDA